MMRIPVVLCGSLLLWTSERAYAGDAPDPALAILQKRCSACHGDSSGMSGLKLTSRENLLHGGSRGAAVVPGKSADSLLFQAVSHTGKLTMPPGTTLPADEVEAIKTWIDRGAHWDGTPVPAATASANWWAFRKPQRPAVPGHAPNPIDGFLNEKMRAAGVEPSEPAARLALLRRASYDLLGLPPSTEQISAFLNDRSPDAWSKVIDGLLSSPRYGEKWGRHWLDLVRYGDTSGYEHDAYIPEAWRYRDYVIKSFNDDKPYDRFAKEQIAGDELYTDDAESRTGTGYYRVAANLDLGFKVEDLNVAQKRSDWVDTTSAVFLGLTVGCARCHDHKFDPIPQRDYYRMQAIFAPAINDRVLLDYNPAKFYDIAAVKRDFRLHQLSEQIARIQKPYRDSLRKEKIAKMPEPVRKAMQTKDSERTPEQQALVQQSAAKVNVSDAEIWAALSPADAERMSSISRALVSMYANYGPPPTAPGIVDVGREAPRTYIALRGNPDAPGEEVRPGFLTVLGGGEIPDPPLHVKSTGRRKALAEWLASASNPLFARVMVNRIWQYHFGTGLVKTSSDFGTRAGSPTHPALLDWLAIEFAERKWSIKAMHRLIMTSEAYCRSANGTESARAKDPANELLSHMNRRRLQSEEIHDAALQVSGELNLKMGGIPAVPPLAAEEMYGIIGKPEEAWPVTPNPAEHRRRSIYMLTRRTFQQPMAEAFDTPDGVLTCPRRNESTTAPQSLALLNSRFMMDRARALSAKVGSVEDAWQRVLGRALEDEEKDAARQFLAKQEKLLGSAQAAMAELIRSLLNTNEFLYVD
jgi:Protein of unknown function (DUF1553)/Protein of unknown function (DUF1549)/Planctomycete cytochrome C